MIHKKLSTHMLVNLLREEDQSTPVLHFDLTFLRTGNLFRSLSPRTDTPTWLIAMLHSLTLLCWCQWLTSRCNSLKACGPPQGGKPQNVPWEPLESTLLPLCSSHSFTILFWTFSTCVTSPSKNLNFLDVDQQLTVTSTPFPCIISVYGVVVCKKL